jgi:hypothetical protein
MNEGKCQMRLSELIEMLQACADECEAAGYLDPQVQIHYQQNYPLRCTIANVTPLVEAERGGDEPVVNIAIATGSDLYDTPYGSRKAWEEGNDLPSQLEEFKKDNTEEEDEE